MDLPEDPVKITLGIYHKETCSTVFIVALFTIIKKWKQLRYPTIEDGINNLWYM